MAILRASLLSEAGFAHAFAERSATDAEILAALGASAVGQVKQVHGARCVEATELVAQEADAIVARAKRTAGANTVPSSVGIRVADCVPLLVGDCATGDAVAIHAGWRGLVAGVVRAGVERLSGRPLVAAIGPCIGVCCFEVGVDVAESIAAVAPRAHAVDPTRLAGDKRFVDLRTVARAQLVALGLSHDRIEDVPGCTRHEAGRFHSFRRDGASSGRMLAAITPKRYP